MGVFLPQVTFFFSLKKKEKNKEKESKRINKGNDAFECLFQRLRVTFAWCVTTGSIVSGRSLRTLPNGKLAAVFQDSRCKMYICCSFL